MGIIYYIDIHWALLFYFFFSKKFHFALTTFDKTESWSYQFKSICPRIIYTSIYNYAP